MLANANVTSLRVTAVVELNPVGAVRLVSVVIAAPHAANRNKNGCRFKNGDRKEEGGAGIADSTEPGSI